MMVTFSLLSLSLLTSLARSSSSTGYEKMFEMFHDRVEVGLCRALCSHHHPARGEESQCWSLCHLLASHSPTWTRLCHGPGLLCSAPCLTACSHFSPLSEDRLEDGLTLIEDPGQEYIMNNCSLSLPRSDEVTVYLVVGEDSKGDWYELSQTRSPALDLPSFITNIFIIRIPYSGQLAVTEVAGCGGPWREPWEVRLFSVGWEGEIVKARVTWDSPLSQGRVAVSWNIGAVLGVLETNQSWADIPLPPLSTAVIQVTDLQTGATSDALTVQTPPVRDSRTVLTLTVAGVTIAALLVILVIIIYLYRHTPSPAPTPAGSQSSLSPSHQERSLISFDTFVRQNRISVLDLHKPKHAELFVV